MTTQESREFLSKVKDLTFRFRSPVYFARKFEKNKFDEEKANNLLNQGLRIHPQNLTLNYLKANVLLEEGDKERALQYWRKVVKDCPDFFLKKNDYKKVYSLFQKQGDIKDCIFVLERNVLDFPKDDEILNKYIHTCIQSKTTNNYIKICSKVVERTIPYCDDADKRYLFLSVLYKLMGNTPISEEWMKKVNTYDTELPESLVVELYNNQESKIEYYKKASNTKCIVVTFDHMYMNWKQPPFGFPFLEKKNIDVIAIRKRKKKTFQQDLSLESFVRVVKPLLHNYTHIVFYGHSLGAYLALYYGAVFKNIEMLVTAPRLSIHPVYGKAKLANKGFKHNIQMNYNENLRPIIVYDSKNNRDQNYVEKDIITSYPNAHLIQIPYGGHGMVKHLQRMGKLKEFITMVLNNKVPVYEKEYRFLSSDYYRELANKCFKRKKTKWAYYLVEEALKLSPDDYRSIKLSVEVYMEIQNWDKALELLNQRKHVIDKRPDLLLYIFDIYINIDEFQRAEKILEEITRKYKKKKPIEKRKTMLEKHKPATFIIKQKE